MVDDRRIRRWVRDVRNGGRSPAALLEELRRLPFEQIGDARVDTHRRLRRGLPEVILGEGKTAEQLIRIAGHVLRDGELVLITRLEPSLFEAVRRAHPTLRYDPLARLAFQPARRRQRPRGFVVVVTGGTSDAPIAEEAARTLELLGSRAAKLYDAGVAGVHRLLSQWHLLQRARAIVVVAGMEGALASVVAGLVRCIDHVELTANRGPERPRQAPSRRAVQPIEHRGGAAVAEASDRRRFYTITVETSNADGT